MGGTRRNRIRKAIWYVAAIFVFVCLITFGVALLTVYDLVSQDPNSVEILILTVVIAWLFYNMIYELGKKAGSKDDDLQH